MKATRQKPKGYLYIFDGLFLPFCKLRKDIYGEKETNSARDAQGVEQIGNKIGKEAYGKEACGNEAYGEKARSKEAEGSQA